MTSKTTLSSGLLVFSLLVATVSSREHKVHNVVLYPDRHAWCDVTAIQQVVSHPRCRSQTIDNHVCVGTCFSFSVPRTIPTTPGDETLHYCDSCQPSVDKWIQVTLECPDDPELGQMSKQVQVISNCSCNACSRNVDHSKDPAISSDDDTQHDDDLISSNTLDDMTSPIHDYDVNITSQKDVVLGEVDDEDGEDLDEFRFRSRDVTHQAITDSSDEFEEYVTATHATTVEPTEDLEQSQENRIDVQVEQNDVGDLLQKDDESNENKILDFDRDDIKE